MPPVALQPGTPAVLPLRVNARGLDLRACLAVARVESAPEGVAAHRERWLCGAEQARLDRFLVEPARADFLAGRIAAKAALQALESTLIPNQTEIVPGIWQQPCLRPESRNLAITLAHAGGIGVAFASDDRWLAGIDLESVERADRETIASVVSVREREWADAAGDATRRAERWMALWTGREALGKMLRIGIARPGLLPALRAFEETTLGWRACADGVEDVRIRATRVAGFILSIAAPEHDESAKSIEHALCWARSILC